MNNEKTCRSCLEEQIPMISLYDIRVDIDENMQLNEVIRSIAKIEVDLGDGLPDKICQLCIEELSRTIKFITQLQDSDKALRSIEVLDISMNKSGSFTEESVEIQKNGCVKIESMEVDAKEKSDNVDSDNESEDSLKLHLAEDSVDSREDDEDDPPVVNLECVKIESAAGNLMEREHDYCNSNIENNSELKPYSCNLCDNKFKTKSSLKTHTQKLHEFEYKCDHCEKSFPEQMHLKVHMRAHFTDDQKPYICTKCGAPFPYEYQLTQHSYKHTKEKPFPCPKCDKGCLTADSLKRHLKIHEKDYEKRTHSCRVCGKVYAYPSFLAEHMKNHTGEKPYLCSVCGKGFRQRGALVYHIRTHQNVRPFECEICKNSFVSQGILKVHMRRHTDERPYVCDICGRGFRQSSDCKMHRRIHLGLKLVECTVCKKKMSTTGQLTIHMRMHTGEKPFSCPQCYRRFATRTMVAKHVRTHTGEKPYVCKICGRAFSQSSSLGTHTKIHEKAREKEKKEKKGKENPKKIVIVKHKKK